ncbi:hypothetical protein [Actinokineospora sp. NPDC004072]
MAQQVVPVVGASAGSVPRAGFIRPVERAPGVGLASGLAAQAAAEPRADEMPLAAEKPRVAAAEPPVVRGEPPIVRVEMQAVEVKARTAADEMQAAQARARVAAAKRPTVGTETAVAEAKARDLGAAARVAAVDTQLVEAKPRVAAAQTHAVETEAEAEAWAAGAQTRVAEAGMPVVEANAPVVADEALAAEARARVVLAEMPVVLARARVAGVEGAVAEAKARVGGVETALVGAEKRVSAVEVPIAGGKVEAVGGPLPVAKARTVLPGQVGKPRSGAAGVEVPVGVRATAEQRQRVRLGLGSRYDVAVRAVSSLLSERPGLRVGGEEGLVAELAVVHVFAEEPRGQYDVDFYSCLAGGLRRLPTARAVVVRGVPADVAAQEGDVVRLPTPVVALPAQAPTPVGPGEALIWTTTARRLDGLRDGGEVVLPGHTRLRVLGVEDGRVLLGEVGAPVETALARLRAAAAARAPVDPAVPAVDRWFGELPAA